MISTFKKRAIKKAIDQISLEGVSKDYDYNFQTLGILIDKKEVGTIQQIVSSFQQNGFFFKDVKVLVYTGLLKDKTIVFPSFNLTNFTLNGHLKSASVDDFIATDFDLLINFYDKDIVPLVYVSTKVQAKFKVGISTVTSNVNHFSLEVKDLNPIEYVNHLTSYINIFKTK